LEVTGAVMEAMGSFDGLAGRTVSMSGVVELSDEGAPPSAPGEFAIS
jgi:hypothetical protein